MDVNELKEILQVLDERQIAEFELEKEGIKLRVRRAEGGSAQQPSIALRSSEPPPAPAAPPVAETRPDAAPEPGVSIVRSPIVGTFYRAGSPDAAAFTDVGQRVQAGQVLCIIEAMKLMNEIEAESGGEVVTIHVENGAPVQYGDPLFSIRAD